MDEVDVPALTKGRGSEVNLRGMLYMPMLSDITTWLRPAIAVAPVLVCWGSLQFVS